MAIAIVFNQKNASVFHIKKGESIADLSSWYYEFVAFSLSNFLKYNFRPLSFGLM